MTPAFVPPSMTVAPAASAARRSPRPNSWSSRLRCSLCCGISRSKPSAPPTSKSTGRLGVSPSALIKSGSFPHADASMIVAVWPSGNVTGFALGAGAGEAAPSSRPLAFCEASDCVMVPPIRFWPGSLRETLQSLHVHEAQFSHFSADALYKLRLALETRDSINGIMPLWNGSSDVMVDTVSEQFLCNILWHQRHQFIGPI